MNDAQPSTTLKIKPFLPTRTIENYKYTDFIRLLPECVETELHLGAALPIPPEFLTLLNQIDPDVYPLAGLALKAPSESNRGFYWKNELHCLRIKRGEQSTLTLSESVPFGLTNSLYAIILEEGASLRVEVNTLSREGLRAQHLEVWQDKDSSLEVFYANQGQRFGRYDLHVHLRGERARCRAYGFYRGQMHDHIDHHLWFEHSADHTESEQFFKGTLEGQSHAVFNGKATIHPNVKHASVKQHNFNLLLSSLAEINTKPELEVFSDVVSAAHGATVGKLDEEALFYLMSRGIEEPIAKEILIEGFLAEVRRRFIADHSI
jgi:Fe-S cluster assembly scaffold protein SufB